MNPGRYSLRFLVLVVIGFLFSPAQAQEQSHTVVFDHLRMTFPAFLATGIQVEFVEAIPLQRPDEQMWTETYPEHLRFSFLDYLEGREFRLPYPFARPTIFIYSTASIREFGYGLAEQFDDLTTLLRERPDLAGYVGATVRLPETRLPFLPWINAAQVLRSHPQYMQTVNSSGIRYLTYYSQEAAHLTDQQVFYTFQGIIADGMYYVAAVLPVKTGVLPEEVDTRNVDWDSFAATYDNYLTRAFARIDDLPDNAFTPNLLTLDAVIQSITVENGLVANRGGDHTTRAG